MVAERREAAVHLVEKLIADFGYTELSAGIILGYFQRHNESLEY